MNAPAVPESPDPDLLRRCERIEAEAFASMIAAAPPGLAGALTLRTARIAGTLAIASPASEKRMCNYVFGLGVHADATAGDVEAIEEHSRSAGARRCRVALAPTARAEPLAASLAARGFSPYEYWLRLWRNPSAPAAAPASVAPTSLVTRELGAADAAAFGATLAEVFAFTTEFHPWFEALAGRERWRLFGSFDGDQMVGCGALYYEGKDGWLGLGATRTAWRGRGAQSAIIAVRVAAGRELGLESLAVETGADTPEKPNSSTHNLRREGFTVLYERPNWLKVLREP